MPRPGRLRSADRGASGHEAAVRRTRELETLCLQDSADALLVHRPSEAASHHRGHPPVPKLGLSRATSRTASRPVSSFRSSIIARILALFSRDPAEESLPVCLDHSCYRTFLDGLMSSIGQIARILESARDRYRRHPKPPSATSHKRALSPSAARNCTYVAAGCR